MAALREGERKRKCLLHKNQESIGKTHSELNTTIKILQLQLNTTIKSDIESMLVLRRNSSQR